VTTSNLMKATLTSSLQQQWDVLRLNGCPVLANRLILILWCYSEILHAVLLFCFCWLVRTVLTTLVNILVIVLYSNTYLYWPSLFISVLLAVWCQWTVCTMWKQFRIP
jgi:hypothetical protein